jgi:methylated-DNA-[protein]-cysteine S-methyltransferase
VIAFSILRGEAQLQEPLYSTSVPSAFGTLDMVWRETPAGPKIRRLLLPGERIPADEVTRTTYTDTESLPNPAIRLLAERIQRYLKGEAVQFEVRLADLEECSEFQRRVLLAEYGVPRGWVSTYGRIAMRLGSPGAARAVGTALSRNPFPIIIPCHRTIRSDGHLGGFRGGPNMKRALLELEGVEFSTTGKVPTGRFYY